jgi:hypothetical protein
MPQGRRRPWALPRAGGAWQDSWRYFSAQPCPRSLPCAGRSTIISAHDATVSIALPTIGRDFLTSLAARLWVMNGSTLTLAAFLLIGGRSATGSAGGRST